MPGSVWGHDVSVTSGVVFSNVTSTLTWLTLVDAAVYALDGGSAMSVSLPELGFSVAPCALTWLTLAVHGLARGSVMSASLYKKTCAALVFLLDKIAG